MRDFNGEYQDASETTKYAYDFDNILRTYMVRTFAPFLPEGKALELGCYKGDFTNLLLQHYDSVTVVEASSELAEHVETRFAARVFVVNDRIETASIDGEWDAIFLIHTLEHIDDVEVVLKRMRNWLSPRGRLFLAVPNANAASRQIAVKMGIITHNTGITEAEYTHGHRRTYALDTLYRDVTKAGWKVMQSGGVFFKPFANFQFDRMLLENIVDQTYLEGCYQLGMTYADLCASIYVVCEL